MRPATRAVTTGARWTCAPAQSDIPQRMRTLVVEYATAQTPFDDTMRSRFQLARLPADSIVVVDAPEVCDRAGLAYARSGDQHLSPGVYEMAVIRAGNRYFVRGVTAPSPAGEWNMITVLDLKFHGIFGILGF